MSKRPLLLLIDGSHALFRAFHAIRNMRGPDGRPTNAVFGWTSMLLKMMQEHEPDYVVACFDGSSQGFRKDIDPNYKANRSPTPPELLEQWPIALEVTQELGVKMLEDDKLEADDLIATLAEQAHQQGVDVLISSGDKDLMALVRDPAEGGAFVRQLEEKKGKAVIYDEAGVFERWGVRPDQIGDLLAIMGDSVDNVPGVKGIGKKGAVKLLTQWGSFADIYAHIDEVQTPRTQRLLRESQEAADMSRRLVELVRDAELGLSMADLAPVEPQRDRLTERFSALGFKRLLRQYFASAAQVSIDTTVVRTASELARAAAMLGREGVVGLYAVTSERDEMRHLPMRGELVGIALAGRKTSLYAPISRPRTGVKVDLFAAPEMTAGIAQDDAVAALGALLADPEVAKVGHDLKYTAIALRRAGMPVAGLRFDSMLAAYLLHAGRSTPSLSHLAIEHLNCRVADFDATFGAGRNKVAPAAVDHATIGRFLGERAAVPLLMEGKLRKLVGAGDLEGLHD